LVGWFAGLVIATYMPIHTYRTLGHFSSLYALHVGSMVVTGFVGLYALGVNLVVTLVFTLAFDAMRIPRGADRTQPADYLEAA
jgi:SSS family solute:Na+ symporter